MAMTSQELADLRADVVSLQSAVAADQRPEYAQAAAALARCDANQLGDPDAAPPEWWANVQQAEHYLEQLDQDGVRPAGQTLADLRRTKAALTRWSLQRSRDPNA